MALLHYTQTDRFYYWSDPLKPEPSPTASDLVATDADTTRSGRLLILQNQKRLRHLLQRSIMPSTHNNNCITVRKDEKSRWMPRKYTMTINYNLIGQLQRR